MGRKSRLTPEQWTEIERKHLIDGASINSLAKAYGVDESAIRRKINPNKSEPKNSEKSLRDLALEKLAADAKSRDISEVIATLPISRQQTFSGLMTKLANVSGHLASAAEFGAATAHRLAGLAHAKVQEIDDAAPLDAKSLESLKGVAVLTKMSNDAAATGLNLLNANKETVKSLDETEETPPSLEDFYGGLPKPEPSPA